MKFLIFLKFFITVFFISFSTVLCAQSDVILKTDGEEMKGKVIKINDTTIEFIYENESLEYEVSIGDIKKITFASGRIQFFNKEEKQKMKIAKDRKRPENALGRLSVFSRSFFPDCDIFHRSFFQLRCFHRVFFFSPRSK